MESVPSPLSRRADRFGSLLPPEPGETRIWAHLAQARHGLGVLSLYPRLVENFGPLRLVITGHPATLSALPPLPDGVTTTPAPDEKRRDIRAFLDRLRPSLCLWSGGAFHPMLLGDWHRRGGASFLIEAQAELLNRPMGLRLPGTMRSLARSMRHAWPVDNPALERLIALGLTETQLTPNGGLQIAPPVPPADGAAMMRLSQGLVGRQIWCAVAPSLSELQWLGEIHDQARGFSHRLLLAVIPRPGLERDSAAYLTDRLRATIAPEDGVVDDRAGAVILESPEQTGLWLRLALLAFLGGSCEGSPMANPMMVAGLGASLAVGPHHAPHDLAIEALREVDALYTITTPFEDISRGVLEAMQPGIAADRAAKAWERLTRGARASDALTDTVLDVLEGAA